MSAVDAFELMKIFGFIVVVWFALVGWSLFRSPSARAETAAE